jgi:hypothetical protein
VLNHQHVAPTPRDRSPQPRELPYETVEAMAAGAAIPVTASPPVVVVGGYIGPAAIVWIIPAGLFNAAVLKIGGKSTIAISPVAAHCKDL